MEPAGKQEKGYGVKKQCAHFGKPYATDPGESGNGAGFNKSSQVRP